MADQEAAVANGDMTEQAAQVNSEETAAAKATPAGETEPQETENEGELDEHGKRRSGWQRTKEKLDRLEERNEFLLRELLKRTVTPEPKDAEGQTSATPTAPTTEPKPDDFALGDGTYDIVKFNKAHVDWLWEQKESQIQSKKQAESAKSEEKKIWESWVASRDKAAEKYSDMEEVLQVPVIPDSKAQPEKYKFVSREIMSSPYAGELAYYLGKHPEEAFALWEKSNLEIVRGLGRIEAQFARAESAEPATAKEPIVPPVTQAPKPATPIKKTSAANAPVDPRSPDSDKLSPDEWLKARRAQLKGK